MKPSNPKYTPEQVGLIEPTEATQRLKERWEWLKNEVDSGRLNIHDIAMERKAVDQFKDENGWKHSSYSRVLTITIKAHNQ